VQIWRTKDWTLAHQLNAQGTTPHGLGIAFSADSRMLAVGEPNGEVRLVDPSSGLDLARISYPAPQASAILCFTRDQRQLIAMPSDRRAPARLWNLAALREALRKYHLDWPRDSAEANAAGHVDSAPVKVKWLDGGWLSTSPGKHVAGD
jgi:WD40 repeat protein